MTIASDFRGHGIEISEKEELLFSRLLEAFIAYNSHTNLSAIRDPEGIILKHFIDSAILSRFERLSGKLLDIGTGGGFPGIPLKILFPHLAVTLLDSVGKKTKACDSFISELGLSNIQTVHARAEDAAKTLSGSFDFVVSRATAYMPDILSWAYPFLARKGCIILYKTPSEEELLDAKPILKKLGLTIERTHSYELSLQDRKIYVISRS